MNGRLVSGPLPADLVERLIGVRRWLHQHPELSNQEVETTAFLRAELEQLGALEIRPLRNTGLVADLTGRLPGPTVVVRADIDALPIQEQTELAFRSETPGVMHACGHDVHSTLGLGAAALASAHRESLAGTLRFIFQHAEEAEPLGGRAVVEDGHLDGVAAAVALHVDPSLETGTVGLIAGPNMASSDEFTITVRGRNSHAGWPQDGVDAIVAAAAIVGELQKVVARRIDPRKPAVLNVGRIEGGRATNVLADQVLLAGTVRTLDQHARERAHELLREVSRHTAAANGAEATVELVTGEPVLSNDASVIDEFTRSCERIDGLTHRILAAPTMNSEDFAFYTAEVPAAIAWIGVRKESAGATHPFHHPLFAVDEAVIPLGVELLLQTATALLADPPAAKSREK